MARGTWVWRDGALVEKHSAAPLFARGPAGDLAVPYLNRDGVDAFFSHADGGVYESKSQYRQMLKANGYREIGTDVEGHVKEAKAKMPSKPIDKPDVIEAYKKVRDGYKPAPLAASFGDGLPED